MHPHSVLLKIKVYHITIRFDKDINLNLTVTGSVDFGFIPDNSIS